MKYNTEIVVKWFAEHGLTAVPEYRFAPPRKWRFDFVVARKVSPEYQWKFMGSRVPFIALEIEGGVWTQGRHTRGSGFVKDMEKYNRAAVLGWRVLRTTPDQLCMQDTIDMIKEALGI